MISLRSARGRLGRVPECRNVGGDRQDPTAFLLREPRRLFIQESIIFFLQIALCTQRLLPLLLQAPSHQAILGLDGLVLAFGTLDLIGGTLEPLLPVPVEALAFPLHVLDRLQAQLQGRRLQGPKDLLVTRSSMAADASPRQSDPSSRLRMHT